MKKHLITLACVLIGTSGMAQSANTTFYHPNYEIQGKRITVVPSDLGDNIVFSNSVRDFATSTVDKFMLVRTDPAGGFINASLQYHELEKHHIITTADNGVLVAGYPNGLSNGFAELAVMKFDGSLNLQWSKIVPIIARSNPYPNLNPYEREGIGIEAIPGEDDQEEDYYITFNQGNPDPSFSNEGVISVIRMDQSGNLVWHKVYPDPMRANNVLAFLNDGVNDITAYPSPDPASSTPNLLCITGTSFREKSPMGSGLIGNEIFFLSIDENGNLQNSNTYLYTNTAHRCYSPDQIWDPNSNHLVTVYEEQWNWQSGTFQPVIIKFNPDFSVDRHVRIENLCDHFSNPNCGFDWSVRPQGISLRQDGDYTISCWEISNEFGRQRNSGFMKVPSAMNSGVVVVPIMYNIYQDQVYFGQKHFADARDYHYMVPTVNKSFHGSLPVDLPRLIKIDPSLHLEACDRHAIDLFMTTAGGLLDKPYGEIAIDLFDKIYDFGIESISLDQDFCQEDPNPEYYRISKTPDQSKKTSISPTLLGSSSQSVNCELYSESEGYAEVSVFNAVGQILYKERISVNKGANSFSINAAFAIGMNMVKISVNNTITIHKVVVQE